MAESTPKHDAAGKRFVIDTANGEAMLTYQRDGNTITFTHTEVPGDASGQGIGSRLAQAALQYARGLNLHVIPRCPFVAGYIERHPEFAGLAN